MLPPSPPRRQARHELEPPAAFRTPARTAQLWHLRAAAIGHLHPDKTVPRADRDRDCPARSARPAVPDAVAEQLAHQQGGVIPARVPGTEHPPTNARATRARSARPATVTLSRICGPAISAPAFPGRPPLANRPGAAGRVYGCTLDSAAYVKPEPVAGAACPWLSVESRRCAPTVLAAGRRPLTCIAAVTASGSAVGRIYGLRACFTVPPCPDCCRFLRAGGRVRGREAPAEQSREVKGLAGLSRVYRLAAC